MHDTQISYEISNALNSTTTSITTQVVFGVLNKKKTPYTEGLPVCDLVSWPEPLDKFSSSSAWMTFIRSCWTILIFSHIDT
jgi:hypothetical protein